MRWYCIAGETRNKILRNSRTQKPKDNGEALDLILFVKNWLKITYKEFTLSSVEILTSGLHFLCKTH